jgi:hypothetical protein
MKLLTTVNIQKPDDPVFEQSFSGHFLSPVFECKMAAKAFDNRTHLSGFRMVITSLDRFANEENFLYL